MCFVASSFRFVLSFAFFRALYLNVIRIVLRVVILCFRLLYWLFEVVTLCKFIEVAFGLLFFVENLLLVNFVKARLFDFVFGLF